MGEFLLQREARRWKALGCVIYFPRTKGYLRESRCCHERNPNQRQQLQFRGLDSQQHQKLCCENPRNSERHVRNCHRELHRFERNIPTPGHSIRFDVSPKSVSSLVQGQGMDEMEFQEADKNVRDLITEYQDKEDAV